MDPVLYKAATSGSIDLFKEKNPSFFVQETKEKNSALHLAAKFKQKQFAKEIIALHPKLLYQANSKGDTPLHIAANVGCLEIADLIIASHLDTESRDVEANKDLLTMQNLEKDTALHNAVRNDHFEIVKLLTDKDKELASKQKEKKELAANIINGNGDSSLLLALARKKELAAHIINGNGDSPLFLAVDRSHFTIASYILDKVPDCSYQGRNQMNALHAAILRVPYRMLESFLSVFYRNRVVAALEKMSCLRIPAPKGFMEAFIQKFPSAIKGSDKNGWTPLHYAAFRGNTIAVELLLKNNDEQMPAHTYVYHQDKEGRSALHIAAKKGQVQVMKQLTETFPDICELVDEKGRTALHVAVENGRFCTVKYVLKTPSLEGLINVQDTNGNTSLHLAAENRRVDHYKIVKILLGDTRVDKKAKNKEGFTAIKIIVSKMELSILQRSRIAMKLLWADGLRSLEGILKDENSESMKGEDENERERRRAENKEYTNFQKIAVTHLLVATIIATVTFAAGFTMPGGYKSDGPDEGMANLSRKTAFKSFLISDTIAFCFSATSMLFHFYASLRQRNRCTFMCLTSCAGFFTSSSLVAMVIAFISGTNVVLAGSPGLAIANIALGCCFFLFFFLMIFVPL